MPPAFQYIPSMLASYDWQMRHAGLVAIATVVATRKGSYLLSLQDGSTNEVPIMNSDLGQIVNLIIPLFNDSHPRVRHAACQCAGGLSSNTQRIIQRQYSKQLFVVLTQALEDPKSRIHCQATASLTKLCEGIDQAALVPYLDPIIERLLKLISPPGDNATQPKRYVVEQVISTLAVLTNASQSTFS